MPYLYVSMHQPLDLPLWKGEYENIKVCNDLRARCAHEDKTGTGKSAQVLTQKK